jgi:hypothetical protein
MWRTRAAPERATHKETLRHEFPRIFETQVQKGGRGVSPQKLFLSLLLAA